MLQKSQEHFTPCQGSGAPAATPAIFRLDNNPQRKGPGSGGRQCATDRDAEFLARLQGSHRQRSGIRVDAASGIQECVLIGVVRRAVLQQRPDKRRLSRARRPRKDQSLSSDSHHAGMDKDEGSRMLRDEELQVTLEHVERSAV